ncbi:subtilase-type protease inhibitor [Streptomyces sp. SKN60]|uniref:subtilase-type protease inhibitor n=1 Tax=Streptomyces sp. SKN60 TaxID=2855506 RepID=UPI0022453A5B|nr:subtilase-type protease inhibitor [Streptomyces sp. SKN60]MCX2180930.1 subtilase-type protease inhibitor [Streptomyces sp. SKN60]
MRYFRTLGATAFATATGLALLSTAFTGSATAEPVSADSATTPGLYAPTALVLTVGQGEHRSSATIVRAVTLACSPTPSGTHPAPVEACRELTEAKGDFTRLGTDSGSRHRPCTREWEPVTVTGDGVWQGKRVRWTATYGNGCELRAATGEGTVFAF